MQRELCVAGETTARRLPGRAQRPGDRSYERLLGRVLRGLQDGGAPAEPGGGRKQVAIPGTAVCPRSTVGRWLTVWCVCWLGILCTALYRVTLQKHFLGAFAKLRKATVRFVMSVRPSVRLSVRKEQLGSHWTDFDETWCLNFLRKSVEKLKFIKLRQK